MTDKRSDLHPSFTSLASCLGGVGQMQPVGTTSYCWLPDFTVTEGGVVIHAVPHIGSKGGLFGAWLSVTTSTPLAPAPIVLRRERWLDRLGSRLAINKEVELGDPRFDRLVYIESDGDETAVRRVLADPRTREACGELVASGVVASITIGGSHRGLGARPEIQLEIPTPAFDNVAALRAAMGSFARLANAVVETARAGDPYRGALGAVGGVTPQRTARGVALGMLALASWVGLLVVSLSNPPTFGLRAFGLGGCAGLLFWLAFDALAIALLRHRSTSLRNVFIFAFLGIGWIPFGGSVGVACNRAFDREPPRAEAGVAVVRYRSKGGPLDQVTLTADGASTNIDADIKLASGPSTFTSSPKLVVVTVGPGALGSPYVLAVAPAR
jgi:hypothetical protein